MHDSGEGVENGSIAAVVNGVEITNRQVEYLYRRAAVPGMNARDSLNLKRRILRDLVRIELLAGKAREMQLDKSPDYSMALYAAQKRVLAGFAEKRIIKEGASAVSAEEAEAVVLSNAHLFADRKLFVYDKVMISSGDVSLLESLDAMIQNGAALKQLLDELNVRKIPFKKTVKAQTSEKIPSPLLAVLQNLKPDLPQVVNTESKVSILLLLHDVIPVPLEGESATKAATVMIMTQHKARALSKTMGDLVDGAAITYYGEYAAQVDDNQQFEALPVPDHSRVTRKRYKDLAMGLVLSGSFLLAVLALTALMRTFYSKLWLPRLWPQSSRGKIGNSCAAPPNWVPWSYRFYLFVMAVLVLGALGMEVVAVWAKIPLWGLLGGVAGGVVVGVLLSRVYQLDFVRQCSRKAYSLLVGVLTVPILLAVLVMFRLSSFYR